MVGGLRLFPVHRTVLHPERLFSLTNQWLSGSIWVHVGLQRGSLKGPRLNKHGIGQGESSERPTHRGSMVPGELAWMLSVFFFLNDRWKLEVAGGLTGMQINLYMNMCESTIPIN